MTVGVALAGDTELVARLDHAHAGILDLSGANRHMAQLVERQAGADAPRATGALASSSTIQVGPTSWGVLYGKPYATPVHWGTRYMTARPWLLQAARATEDSWMDVLTEDVQQLLE